LDIKDHRPFGYQDPSILRNPRAGLPHQHGGCHLDGRGIGG
jgi:hypothetical protein